jgi:hypothetical protein
MDDDVLSLPPKLSNPLHPPPTHPSSFEVSSILALVNASNVVTFDSDPDTVDGMSTHEIFVDNDDLRRGSVKESMKLDGTAKGLAERRPLREQLQKIMR